MKLGLVTYNVARDWTLDEILRNCAAAGVAGVELRSTHAHGVELALGSSDRAEVRRRFAESGVTLWGLGTVCEFHSPDPAQVQANVESCRAWCGLAHDIGAAGVKVRPNGLQDGVPVETTLTRIADALRLCGEAADEAGVEIWLEVHGGGTAHPPHIRTILDRCGHPRVGACWNCNDSDVVDGSVAPYFELLGPYLKSCHITELWSRYPYRELFALMAQTGYDRFALCEASTPFSAAEGTAFLSCYRALWECLSGAPEGATA